MILSQFLILAALLFSLGIYGLLARRNAVTVLLSVELMLAAVNINLVSFEAFWRSALADGQILLPSSSSRWQPPRSASASASS